MVVIRLSRGGTKKRPFYSIVVADKRLARDAKFIERLGYFNPIAVGKEKRLELNQERVKYWVANGAQPSDRVVHLMEEIAKPELFGKRKAKNTVRNLRKKEQSKQTAAPAEEAKAADEAAK